MADERHLHESTLSFAVFLLGVLLSWLVACVVVQQALGEDNVRRADGCSRRQKL